MSLPEGFPKFKEDGYGPCQCGCGVEGRLKKPWRSNGQRCALGCVCRQCRGKAARGTGKSKQQKVARRLGLAYSSIRTGHEENYAGCIRTEVKSGARDAGPVATAYERDRAQSEASRPIGDIRPYVGSYAPKGTGHSYHVVRDDDLDAFALAWVIGNGLMEATQ